MNKGLRLNEFSIKSIDEFFVRNKDLRLVEEAGELHEFNLLETLT